MSTEDVLYRIGEAVDSGIRRLVDFIHPSPSEEPPSFRYLGRLVKKRFTAHEYLSLKLQLAFLSYLIPNLILLFIKASPLWLVCVAVVYFLYLRYTLVRNREFFVEHEPYRFFYYAISLISLAVFLGYLVIRKIATSIYHYYAYLLAAFAVVMAFRWYFKQRYGRDYTYGVVEEIKGDAVRVFVHDDIAANVKPGHYWVDAVGDLEVGRVVKLIVGDRKLKGAVPVRIIEVYLTDQSSQSSTEPKEETE
ncbi:DUF2101 family protein [Thermococcus thioreducens]|uniref:Uncharacterized membrane protein n=1 Tax=Thermococcus thioreducens TaxID=277988 RepID=A0A0Q2M3U1_9EURY|nr:DUF2101 family protein [Thermococcus thioreducens]ASJ11635.1 hypothetical protein A3L14_01460 [Thermococcus thioreducens]KQH82626.1 hypothetical protein AMR53_04980 [Thermococcus thioreducens]SEW16532.1 Uncharacterized membrane protein [Thermococcus thioreducens]